MLHHRFYLLQTSGPITLVAKSHSRFCCKMLIGQSTSWAFQIGTIESMTMYGSKVRSCAPEECSSSSQRTGS